MSTRFEELKERFEREQAQRAEAKQALQEQGMGIDRTRATAFLDSFSAGVQGIRGELDGMAAVAPETAEAETAAARLTELDAQLHAWTQQVSSSAVFLAKYELKVCQDSLDELVRAAKAARERVVPRRKFTFSRRRATPTASNADALPTPAPAAVSAPAPAPASSSASASAAPPPAEAFAGDVITGLSGRHVLRGHAGREMQVRDMRDAVVIVPGMMQAVYVMRLERCRLVLGPVSGALHVTQCRDCVIHLASHQLRVHDCSDTALYAHVRSSPILERCTRMRLAPRYAFSYAGVDDDLRAAALTGDNQLLTVKDFAWLRDTPSPNWRAVDPSEFEPCESADGDASDAGA